MYYKGWKLHQEFFFFIVSVMAQLKSGSKSHSSKVIYLENENFLFSGRFSINRAIFLIVRL